MNNKWKDSKSIFSIPFFIEKIDLNQIVFDNDSDYNKTFRSGLLTTYNSGHLRFLTKESYEYLINFIFECIGQYDPTLDICITRIWRNKYKKTDWQDPHIHPHQQWSFIIYESVVESKTVFLHPYRHLISNQWRVYKNNPCDDFYPKLSSSNIIIFPSWVEHYVNSGNEGITIAGNIGIRDKDPNNQPPPFG
tara:strand:- start:135 stop:710 length:576 start_codon:yes stop_codon:yes gene_type:complete